MVAAQMARTPQQATTATIVQPRPCDCQACQLKRRKFTEPTLLGQALRLQYARAQRMLSAIPNGVESAAS